MSTDKRKYLIPRNRLPGVPQQDPADKGVEGRIFDLLRSHEFTTKYQLYITDTINPHSGLRGLHLNKLDINDQQAHGISFDIEGVNYWDFGMDYNVRDLILCNDNTVPGGTGFDILRFSRALDDTVVGSQSTKAILSYRAGSPAAFTSFFTVEAGDTLGGINLSVNNSASGRSSMTVTQRAANAFVAFSCDNILRFGCDWLKTNVASFFIRDDNATKLRLYMDQNGHFYFGDGSAPTAVIHLRAGTATAGTAPLKLTSGTNLSSIEDGAFEYDGSTLYFSIGATRYPVVPAASSLFPAQAKTANYTLTSNDETVLCDATGGAFTITLPTAAGISGKVYQVKKVDAFLPIVTIATTGGETIDDASTLSIRYQYQSYSLVSDGSNWWII
jgi:hypothetical protein